VLVLLSVGTVSQPDYSRRYARKEREGGRTKRKGEGKRERERARERERESEREFLCWCFCVGVLRLCHSLFILDGMPAKREGERKSARL